MSIDLKFVELTADVLEIFYIKYPSGFISWGYHASASATATTTTTNITTGIVRAASFSGRCKIPMQNSVVTDCCEMRCLPCLFVLMGERTPPMAEGALNCARVITNMSSYHAGLMTYVCVDMQSSRYSKCAHVAQSVEA